MLSIIIPALNEEKYLPLLLESIKKQGFSDYEIIVADAGSKDKTLEIAKKYNCKITNGGLPGEGRNEGAKIAKTKLLLFLDADVVLPPKFLENLLKIFKKQDLDVASFPVYPQGKIIDKIAYGFYNFWAGLSQNLLPHATEVILVKKEIHQLIGGFDEQIKIAEDHDYARRAGKVGKYGFLKIEPVSTSARRFERDGRLKTYLKYFLTGLHMIFLGPVKSDIFGYKFDHYSKDKKNKVK